MEQARSLTWGSALSFRVGDKGLYALRIEPVSVCLCWTLVCVSLVDEWVLLKVVLSVCSLSRLLEGVVEATQCVAHS